jgi:hypothetical protein
MRREMWSGTLAAVVLVATVGVAAQSEKSAEPTPQPPATAQEPAPQPPTTAPEPATAPAQNSDARRITVAGCLQQAPAAPVGTSGSAAPAPSTAATDAPAQASADAKLVLANAVASPTSPGGAAPSNPATTPGSPDSATAQTYRLIANEAALSPHVGKKLELSGTIEESSATSSASGGPMLRVEAGKVIAESCTQ